MKLPKGFGLPNGGIGDLIKQAQTAMEGAKKIEEQLVYERIEVKKGPIHTVFTGVGIMDSFKIDRTEVDINDIEMLEDLILTATNEGIIKAGELKASRLKSVIPNIPGM